jgi:DNA-directed RNA polymerase alpha subunit/DNA-directed RNA polymerase subunit L
MDPKISQIVDEDGQLRFRLTDTNVSFANAVRRVILSDIPTLVFRGAPYAETTIDIKKNTSRHNNEILRHRLSNVPIHHDVDFPVDKYIFRIDIENKGTDVRIVTTADIQVIDTDTNTVVKEAGQKLFPADPVTGDHIQLMRLNPRISDQLPGEVISLDARATIGTAAEDGAFNVACVASYQMTVDEDKQRVELAKHLKTVEAEYKKQDLSAESLKEELEYARRGWLALDGKRITQKDSFDFVVESVGVYKNDDIVKRACDEILAKFEQLDVDLSESGTLYDAFDVQPGEFVMVKLQNYDYTVAKALEAVLYNRNWEMPSRQDGLDYCATIRPHPHIPEIYLRLHYGENLPADLSLEEHSRTVILNASAICKTIFEKIRSQIYTE